MILKTWVPKYKNTHSWEWEDGIKSISAYFDEEKDALFLDVTYGKSEITITRKLDGFAFLCNDNGKTIERLDPISFKRMWVRKKT